ncbi:MAG: hypothetical protein A2W80_13065 [Candidatus Riflebacteria bacterium GWC2_50_8]|nr:MAG: hypothetical protein A2W80_13065 [Candidatus Riflebacteria bacterium GWC2_50_8]
MVQNGSYRLEAVDKKLAAFMGLILLALMMIVLVASNHLFNRLQKDYNERLSIAIAVTISESINRISFSGKFHTRKLVTELISEVSELAYISVESLDNKVFAHSDQTRNDTLIPTLAQAENRQCLSKQAPFVTDKILNDLTINEVIIPFRGGIDDDIMGTVRIGIDFTDLHKRQNDNFSKLLVLIAILTCISILLAYKLSRYFGRSIRYLADQLQGILNHAPMGLVISKADGSIAMASRETASLFPEAGQAKTVDRLNSSRGEPGLAEKLNDLEKTSFASDGYVETELEISNDNDKPTFWQISKFPIARDENGKNSLICSFFRDNTERHIAENRLKESEETFRRLFENSSDAILLLKDGHFVECNRATLVLTGMTAKEQLLGLTTTDIAPDIQPDGLLSSEKMSGKIQQAIEEGYSRFEWLFKKADGSTFFVDMALMPVAIVGSSMLHMTWRDITGYKKAEQEKQKLQEQLLQSQKMDAFGQLAGGVAHDFNNVLAGIMGAAELLKKPDMSPQKHDTLLEMILTASNKAADLTRKLLTFARKRGKDNNPVDVSKVIAESIEIFKRTLNRNISLDYKNLADSSIVMGDGSLLQSVFMNLGINASHAMPNGGNLSFLMQNISLDCDYCQKSPFDLKPGSFVEIEVRDNGCGMPMEIQKRIFEPFFSTKELGKGTGLGLAMAYGAIKDHGGAINVYSEVGVGTVFHIYLPLAEHASVKPADEQKLIRGSGKILLVDDEDFLRSVGKTILETLGYEAVIAADGREAVEIFEKEADEIALVILDMIMPVMSGKEALIRLKKRKPNCLVLVASGFAKEEELAEMKNIGICGFLRKPFRMAELSQMLAKILGKDATKDFPDTTDHVRKILD